MKRFVGWMICAVLLAGLWIQPAAALRANDRVRMGYYEQDNRTNNGTEPISWDVLEIRGNNALLISSSALDCMQYHYKNGAIAWADSDIRNWLVGSFYHSAFSDAERAKIVSGVDAGMYDPVFLLNRDQIQRYNLAYGCDVSAYAAARGVQIGPDNGKGCWWVRMDVTHSDGNTQFVGIHGKVYDTNRVTVDNNGVRPAMWVSVDGLNSDTGSYDDYTSTESYCVGYTKQKLATRCGPSTSFDETHTFNLPVGTRVKVYRCQVTHGTPWVEVEFEYGGKLVRAWTGLKRIDADSAYDQPGDYTRQGSGKLNRSTPGRYGPGKDYRVLYDEIAKGKRVSILAARNGWLLVEFEVSENQLTHRAWVPEERVNR